MEENQFDDALTVAYRFLGYSARSTSEMRRRLERGEFAPDVIEAVISDLTDKGFLNDNQFAQDWIEDRADRKRYGRTRLADELRRKGVERDTIDQHVGQVSVEDEIRRATKAVLARWPNGIQVADGNPKPNATYQYQNSPVNRERARIASYLQRRGFEWSVIQQVLASVVDNR